MRKNALLITVAATALIAGASMASAQTMSQEQPKASEQMKSDAPKAAPKAAQDTQKAAPKAAQDAQKAPESTPKGKAQTTGQAPREGQSGQSGQMPRQDGQSGQTQRQDGQSGQRQDGQSGQRQDGQSGQMQRQDNQAQPRQGQSGQSGASGQAQITTEQRTRISSVIKSRASEARVSNVNFSVSVGTVVPRTVKLVALPEEVIVIHPAWRGYRFFVVDDQIVVVEPDTLRIVAVLPA